jgi:hypothetical protein
MTSIPGPVPGSGTLDAAQFAALTNLMFAIRTGHATSPAECGDILYRHAMPDVDDDTRMLARVIVAYFGYRFDDGGQPVHQPGSGCRFADPDGTCDFHDVRHANAGLDEITAEMLTGFPGFRDGR